MRFTFGPWKIEVLGGYTGAILLLMVALLMFYHSIERLLSPGEIHYNEAIAIANDTPYGLTDYVQTSDSARAKRMVRKLRAGMVQVNGTYLGAQTPFGGYKQSGNGREGSTWGLEEFLEVKAISGI